MHIISELESRFNMPQIKSPEKLKGVLNMLGISHKTGKISASKLSPVQDGINREKVDRIKDSISAGEDVGPIVISKDGSIIDGHHRWVAVKEIDGDLAKILAIRVDLPRPAIQAISGMIGA